MLRQSRLLQPPLPPPIPSGILELTEEAREAHRIFEQRRLLDAVCVEIELIDDGVKECLGQLEEWKGEEQGLLEKVNKCPMCGSFGLTREMRDNVIEYFQGEQR